MSQQNKTSDLTELIATLRDSFDSSTALNNIIGWLEELQELRQAAGYAPDGDFINALQLGAGYVNWLMKQGVRGEPSQLLKVTASLETSFWLRAMKPGSKIVCTDDGSNVKFFVAQETFKGATHLVLLEALRELSKLTEDEEIPVSKA